MRLLISFTIFLSLIGCSRKQEGLSSISIQMPAMHGKVGALASLPVGRVACYGVAIRGPGITGVGATNCHPELGMSLGFVAAGGTLQAEVPKGNSRTFDVYLYLHPTGVTAPCPNMITAFTTLSSQNLYKIGSLPSVTLEKDVEVITIPTTYPGDSNHLYAQNSYPSSCLPAAGPTPKNGFQISSSKDVSTDGATYTLYGRVGRAVESKEVSNGSFKLKVGDKGPN